MPKIPNSFPTEKAPGTDTHISNIDQSEISTFDKHHISQVERAKKNTLIM